VNKEGKERVDIRTEEGKQGSLTRTKTSSGKPLLGPGKGAGGQRTGEAGFKEQGERGPYAHCEKINICSKEMKGHRGGEVLHQVKSTG